MHIQTFRKMDLNLWHSKGSGWINMLPKSPFLNPRMTFTDWELVSTKTITFLKWLWLIYIKSVRNISYMYMYDIFCVRSIGL